MDWRRSINRAGCALLLALALPAVPAAANAAPITEFPTGNAAPAPDGLVDGGDGTLWFIDTNALGHVSPSGTIKEFPLPAPLPAGAYLHAVVAGANGVMWFDVNGSVYEIGKLAPDGTFTTFVPGTSGVNAGAVPGEMTTGPDGTVWFTDSNNALPAIGRITPAGVIKEFTYPNAMPNFESITPGNDGNIWITDRGQTPALVRIAPDGTFKINTIGASPNTMPDGLTPGPDNKMWFTDEGSPAAIGSVPENGPAAEPITEGNHGMQMGSRPDSIIAGSDGRLWFADQYSTSPQLGAVAPATTAVTEYPLAGTPQGIALGIDGDVWVTQRQPEAVVRVKPDGTTASFTDGLPGTADLTEEDIVSGPDGNLWFVDRGTKAIGRADVQLAPSASTEGASAVTTRSATVSGIVDPLGSATTASFQFGTSAALGSTAPAGSLRAGPAPSTVTASLPGLPAGTTIYYRVVAANSYGTAAGAIGSFTTTAVAAPISAPAPLPAPSTRTATTTVGNQRVALMLPVACVAKRSSLRLALSTAAISGSTAPKLRFVSAGLYIDRGLRHVRTRRVHGKARRLTTFTPNKRLRKLPAQPALRLTALRSGQHTLKVRLVFEKRRNLPARKTLSGNFRVC